MIFLSFLVLAGAVVYQANPDGGAVLIAIGCAGAVVKWLAAVIGFKSLRA